MALHYANPNPEPLTLTPTPTPAPNPISNPIGGAARSATRLATSHPRPRAGTYGLYLPYISPVSPLYLLSQAGRLLTLPLEELLLPPQADGRREFCIRSQASTAANAPGKDEPSRDVPILLGTQVRLGVKG